MRWAVLLLLAGGCLYVKTYEEVEEECPMIEPEHVVDAYGPFALSADSIYFMRGIHTLSKIDKTLGPITDLAFFEDDPQFLVVDANHAYGASVVGSISKVPLAGGVPQAIVSDRTEISSLAVDDVGVVYASGGLFRLRHDDSTTEMLADSPHIADIAAHRGRYFYSLPLENLVRRASPVVDLSTAEFPMLLTVDDGGLYVSTLPDRALERASIQLIDAEIGGAPVAVVNNIRFINALEMDANDLYFITGRIDYWLRRAPRAGGDAALLACTSSGNVQRWLAVDASHVYWADGSRLYRLAKTPP